MVSSENELNVSSKNQFFSNKNVPYCLKAGAVAVLSHATVNYQKNSDGHDMFMAVFFDKDIDKSGKSNKIIRGTMNFTFGVPASMGKDNCAASIKGFTELYPAVGDTLEHLADENFSKSDKDICEIIADASAERFRHSAEGSVKNYEEYVSGYFDEFAKQAQAHYPGMVSLEVYENLKETFELACKKKQLKAQPQRI